MHYFLEQIYQEIMDEEMRKVFKDVDAHKWIRHWVEIITEGK